MTEEKKDSQNEADNTAGQSESTDKKKDSQQEEDTSQKNEAGEGQDEKIEISKAELAKLQKKATDFDGIIEKRRLQNLKKDEATVVDPEAVKQMVNEQVANALAERDKQSLEQKKGDYEVNLKTAYSEFIKEHPWADSDDIIRTISGKFSPDGEVDKAKLLIKLEQAAIMTYPELYKKSVEASVAARLSAGDQTINAGDFGGGASQSNDKKYTAKKELTQEQIEFARKCGNDPAEVYKN